jgi:CheY-like chemotaxis protein
MKQVHILLVEDNEGDIFLTKEALEDSKIINKISVVRNGKDALDFVFQRGAFINAESPDLILLDINLPMKNGHEVLAELKSSQQTKHIPIIILTTSSSEMDITKSYNNHANCYVTKPVEVNDFLDAVASIENFWLNIVQLPQTN